MKRFAWLVPVLVLAAGEANAQSRAFAFDIHTGPGAPPEFVCVVHHGPALPGQLHLEASTREQLLVTEGGAATLRSGAVPSAVAEDTVAAWRAMQSVAACGADQPSCVARLQLSAGTGGSLACARNAPWVAPTGKVLVVEVGGEGAARGVEAVGLEGAVVRVTVGPAQEPKAARGVPVDEGVRARVVGGHFEPGPSEAAIGHRVALRPVPRCQERTITLPRTSVERVEISVSRNGQPMSTCRRPVSSSIAVAVPDAPPGTETSLRVSAGKNDIGEASWASVRPPEPIRVSPRQIQFTWSAPCEYPYVSCPDVDIRGAGATCVSELVPPDGRKTDGALTCAYRCEAPSISLPATVAFHAPDRAVSWSAKLESAGQVLRAHLPESSRSFPVRFAWSERSEALLTRPGDRIRLVEVTTPKGVVHRIEPRDGLRVTLPGARCGDTFDSRVIGDRKYEVDTARIERGWLVIPDPKASADPLQVGGLIGGGFLLPASRFGLGGPAGLEARSYGTAQLAFRYQRDPHVESSAFEPRGYELHLSYVIAQQPFFPVHVADEHVEDDAEYLPFNRWMLEALPLWQLGQRTQLGLGMGLGLGFPVRTDDVDAVGPSRLFFIPLSVLGRVQLTRVVSLEGSFRVVGPEKVYRYEPSPFFAGTPERTDETLWSGMLGVLGVRVML